MGTGSGPYLAAILIALVLGNANAEPGSYDSYGSHYRAAESNDAPANEDSAPVSTAAPLSQPNGGHGDKEIEQTPDQVRQIADAVLARISAWVDFVDEHEGSFLVAFFTALLSFFTALLAMFTYQLQRSTRLLARAGERQLDIAEKQNEVAEATASILAAGNRPHMVVTDIRVVRRPIEIEGEDGPEEIPFMLAWEINNAGQTPAIVDRYSVVLTANDAFPEPAPYADVQTVVSVVAPQGKLLPRRPHEFARDTIFTKGLRMGAESQFVFGFVEYHDVNGKKYTNKFCYELIFWDHVTLTGGSESLGFVPAANCPKSYQEYT